MTLLLERGDIPGFKVGRRRRRHEKRGGAWVRGHRVSGLVQLCFRAKYMPHNIGMPDNIFCNRLYRKMNLAQGKIKRQEKQQTASWVIRAILRIGIQHIFSQEGPLSGSDDHRPLLAEVCLRLARVAEPCYRELKGGYCWPPPSSGHRGQAGKQGHTAKRFFATAH